MAAAVAVPVADVVPEVRKDQEDVPVVDAAGPDTADVAGPSVADAAADSHISTPIPISIPSSTGDRSRFPVPRFNQAA